MIAVTEFPAMSCTKLLVTDRKVVGRDRARGITVLMLLASLRPIATTTTVPRELTC